MSWFIFYIIEYLNLQYFIIYHVIDGLDLYANTYFIIFDFRIMIVDSFYNYIFKC